MTSSRIHPIFSLITLGCLLLLLANFAGTTAWTQGITAWLFGTAVVLGAVTLLLGVLNVAAVHVWRIRRGESEWSFSLLLVLSLSGTWVVGLVSPNGVFSPIVSWLFDHLIAPGEAALFALLPFFLAVAAWRYLRLGREGGGWMLAGVLLMVFVQIPAGADGFFQANIPGLNWLFEGPLTAVMQGVLLGGALTVVAVALRLMMGRN